jgi:hypothetical protein
LKDQIFETRNDPAQRTFWGKIFSEIGADLFSLYFCYGKSFNFFLENVWKYLCPHNRQAENEWLYVARAFCAYEYWRFFIIGGARKFPKSLNIDSEFRAFRAVMNKLSLKVHDWEEGEAESRELLPNVTALIKWFHSEFSKYGEPNDLAQKLSGKQIVAAYNTVRRGEIWTDRINEPEYFILKLKKNAGRLDFRARIAAILSLWHTAVVSK